MLNALTSDLHRGENSRYGRPGRIPGSKNIPFEELVEDSQKLISPQKAQAIFKNKNINQKIRVLNYCGGGSGSKECISLFSILSSFDSFCK